MFDAKKLAEALHNVDCDCTHGLPCHRGDKFETYLAKAREVIAAYDNTKEK
jgi:hypothetical protein